MHLSALMGVLNLRSWNKDCIRHRWKGNSSYTNPTDPSLIATKTQMGFYSQNLPWLKCKSACDAEPKVFSLIVFSSKASLCCITLDKEVDKDRWSCSYKVPNPARGKNCTTIWMIEVPLPAMDDTSWVAVWTAKKDVRRLQSGLDRLSE